MAKKLRKVEVDLSRYNEGPKLPERYNDGSTGWHLPNDVPVYGRAHRLLGPTADGESEGLKGWTVELDAWTFGVKVFLRIGMDSTMKLFIQEGDDKPIKLEEWDK